jgi:hypothetical protein
LFDGWLGAITKISWGLDPGDVYQSGAIIVLGYPI